MKRVFRAAGVGAVAVVAWCVSSPASAAAAPQDASGGQAAEVAHGTQVFQRALLLNVDRGMVHTARATAAETMTADSGIRSYLTQLPQPKLTFDGTQLSQLNSLIASAGPAHITVVSRTLTADSALTITGQNVTVDFSGATIEAGAQPPVWLIKAIHARNVTLTNAKITGGQNGILVDSGSNIALEENDLGGLTENGIVVTGASSEMAIRANHLHELGRAGILLDGPVTKTLIEGNEIDHLLGHSNWNAGILLTSRGGDVAADPDTFFLPDHYWVVSQPLVQRLQNPTQNVIRANTVRAGLSSGIYNDGAVANVFLDNLLDGNSKEGVCFDNGATANVFSANRVTNNGNRWGQSDTDLALDSVLNAGRAADGTSAAKLPGISLDNALYNEISANEVTGNFGGGVKMVRTGLINTINSNVITENNAGENVTHHFFGVEIGAAPLDGPLVDLDFVPSSGNTVTGNTIHGKHYSGIFVAAGAVQNDVSGNDIAGQETVPIESGSG